MWTNNCRKVFDILKAMLKNEPVLLAPNYAKEFKLAVVASDTGAGSALVQEDCNVVDHPVRYFSKNLTNIKIITLQLRKNVYLSFLLFGILNFI